MSLLVTGARLKTELVRMTHQTIKKVTEDLEKMRFNTMMAALMEFTNYLAKVKEAGVVAAAVWEAVHKDPAPAPGTDGAAPDRGAVAENRA